MPSSRMVRGLSWERRKRATRIASKIRSLVTAQHLSSQSGSLSSSQALMQNYSNFKSSGAPARFLFFQGGIWNDFSHEACELLKSGYLVNCPIVELPIDGSLSLVDFLRMLQIDCTTGHQNSISWIDVHGRCFFPKVAVDEDLSFDSKLPSNPKLEVEIRVKNSSEEANSAEEHSDENFVKKEGKPCSDNNHPVVILEQPKWPLVMRLKGNEKAYTIIKNMFLAGVKYCMHNTTITSMYRCLHSGPSGEARLQAFLKHIELAKSVGQKPNVRFAWYCSSAKEIPIILIHGFRQPNGGVYLSAVNLLHSSLSSMEADENGEKHVLLCRIILGNMERIEAGPGQLHHPSSEEYDSGVDDIENPMWYFVWSTHMNRTILPEFVVSFKSSDHQQGPRRESAPGMTLSFPKLFAEIGRYLPSSGLQALESFYAQYKANKIRKDVLIRQVRLIAGDKLLVSTIQRIRSHLKLYTNPGSRD